MTALLKIINNPVEDYDKKVIELQKYLNDNSEIVINKKLFILTLLDRAPINPSCGLINTVKSRNRGLFRLHRI